MARSTKIPSWKKKTVLLTGNIEKYQRLANMTDSQMAKVLGCHEKTYRQKVLHPQRFKYEELVMVFTVLEFEPSAILESI